MASETRGPAARIRQIGLTGSLGSGKSTVARLLAERGAAVIDSDALAREATSDPAVLERIAEEFGEDAIEDGRLDRQHMARLVFGDEELRRRLEGLLHPWIRSRSRAIQQALLESDEPPPLIVHDIPLLFEKGMQDCFDAVLVVSAPSEARAARAAARSGLSLDDFRVREQAQWPPERKAALADHLIDNSKDLDSLAAQVDAMWPTLSGKQ
jgi:dephospho-CoA kinase